MLRNLGQSIVEAAKHQPRRGGFRQTSVRLAIGFGAGYAFCWAQDQEDSPAHLIAWAPAAAGAQLATGLRLVKSVLPQDATWPRTKLELVESKELSSLRDYLSLCQSRGLDGARLHRLFLVELCRCLQDQPSRWTETVLCSAEVPSAESWAEIVSLVDNSVVAISPSLAGAGDVELVKSVLGAMESLLSSGRELKVKDSEAIWPLARSALVASSWLAEARRAERQVRRSKGERPHDSEELELVARSLTAVWQGIEQLNSSGRALTRYAPQSVEPVRQDLQVRLKALAERSLPDPDAALCPPQDFLPPQLRGQLTSVLTGGRPRLAPAPVPAATQAGAAAVSSQDSSFPGLLTTASWAVLLGLTLLALSNDGVGLFRLSLLPTPLRDALHDLVEQKAVRVEDLLAKYDGPAEGGQESILLGPWPQ